MSEFIHGHSLRFANFRKSIGIDESDVCENCNIMADSPEHQLFECPTFNCPERAELLHLMGNNIADYNWKIVTSCLSEDNNLATKLFCKVVEFIVENTAESEETAQEE